MKRIIKTIPAFLLITTLFVHAAAAEDAETNTPVQNLVRSLERYNWETSEIGALERFLYSYEWNNLNGVDTSIIAHALSYGRERGIQTPEELAEMAYQLSLSAQEMVRLGFGPREVMSAAMNMVRTMATERVRSRTGEQIPDMSQMFRERLRRQINGAEKTSLQRQAQRRISRPDRSDTWRPPSPGEQAGGGRSNVPGAGGPGGPGGPTREATNGNGGR